MSRLGPLQARYGLYACSDRRRSRSCTQGRLQYSKVSSEFEAAIESMRIGTTASLPLTASMHDGPEVTQASKLMHKDLSRAYHCFWNEILTAKKGVHSVQQHARVCRFRKRKA